MKRGKSKINSVHKGRFDNVRDALLKGQLSDLDQIYGVITESEIGKTVRIASFRRKWADPGKFTFDDMKAISDLFKVNYEAIANLIIELKKRKPS